MAAEGLGLKYRLWGQPLGCAEEVRGVGVLPVVCMTRSPPVACHHLRAHQRNSFHIRIGLLEELVSQSVQLLPLALLGQRVDGRALEPVTGHETCTQEAVGLVRLLRGG